MILPRRIYKIIPKDLKPTSIFVLIALFLNSIFDVLSLSVFIPLFDIVQNEQFQSSKIYLFFKATYGVSGASNFLILLSIHMLFIIIFKNSVSILISRYVSKFSYQLAKELSLKTLVLKYAKGYHYLITNNSNNHVWDVNVLPSHFSNFIVLSFFSLVNELIVLCLIVGGILFFDYKILIILVCTIGPFFLFFYQKIKYKIQALEKEKGEIAPELNVNIQQLIYGYTDVEITGTKDYVFKKYEALLSRVNQMNIRSYIYQLLPSKVIETSIILGVVMLICYGTIFIQNTKDLATFLAVFAIAAFRLLPSGNRMMIALMNLKGYSYTIDRLETLHKEENIEFEKSKNTVNKAKHIDFKDKIILENLSFTYTGSSSISLQNINLEINQGDHIGIIGKSGSGKSTLMKIFLGFLMPESGAFKVDDIMIDSNNMSAWRKKIGYVPQDIFISDATIKENIAFGIDPDKINIDKLNRSIKDASLEEFIGQLPLGINTALGEKGNLISGGQRQRIGIARALYHGAEVLFFDEATSALDNETEKVITESITALSKNKSITTLTIAHREKTLSFCNKIIEMSNGSIKQIKQHGKSI